MFKKYRKIWSNLLPHHPEKTVGVNTSIHFNVHLCDMFILQNWIIMYTNWNLLHWSIVSCISFLLWMEIYIIIHNYSKELCNFIHVSPYVYCNITCKWIYILNNLWIQRFTAFFIIKNKAVLDICTHIFAHKITKHVPLILFPISFSHGN